MNKLELSWHQVCVYLALSVDEVQKNYYIAVTTVPVDYSFYFE